LSEPGNKPPVIAGKGREIPPKGGGKEQYKFSVTYVDRHRGTAHILRVPEDHRVNCSHRVEESCFDKEPGWGGEKLALGKGKDGGGDSLQVPKVTRATVRALDKGTNAVRKEIKTTLGGG